MSSVSERTSRKRRPWRAFAAAFAGLLVAAPPLVPAFAETAGGGASGTGFGRPLTREEKDAVRLGQLGIVTGNPTGTYIQLARDLAVLLDGTPVVGLPKSVKSEPRLRILPIVGRGSGCNVEDLVNLGGVDAVIVQADVLAAMRRDERHRPYTDRFQYITALYGEEIHLLAVAGIGGVRDLAGRRVAVGEACSGSAVTAANLFKLVGIEPELRFLPNEAALEGLKKGSIDAIVAIGGAPMPLFRNLASEDVHRLGLHFVPLGVDERTLQGYAPATLRRNQYEIVLGDTPEVATLAVTSVLAVYDWPPTHPRHAVMRSFARALFLNLDRLRDARSGFSSKWLEVDPTVRLASWPRFPLDPAEVAGDAPATLPEPCRTGLLQAVRDEGLEPWRLSTDDWSARRELWRARNPAVCRR